MLKGLIGKKVGMTQIFDEAGSVIPVTLIEAGPCYVTQVRRPDLDGYSAVQLGLESVKQSGSPAVDSGISSATIYLRCAFCVSSRRKPGCQGRRYADREVFAIGEAVDVVEPAKARVSQALSNATTSVVAPRLTVNPTVTAPLALMAPVQRLAVSSKV
jgi:large subunit ribosomal protein L3